MTKLIFFSLKKSYKYGICVKEKISVLVLDYGLQNLYASNENLYQKVSKKVHMKVMVFSLLEFRVKLFKGWFYLFLIKFWRF